MSPADLGLALGAAAMVALLAGCKNPEPEPEPERGESPHRVQSLDGTWAVAPGELAPTSFEYSASVPGLLSTATPTLAMVGTDDDPNSAYWYRTTFTTEAPPARADLVLHKLKYDASAWLNGELLGTHHDPFSAAVFDVAALLEDGDNELLVRVGASRDSIPPDMPAGMDAEKDRFLPGIYDSVELVTSGSPHVVRMQIWTPTLAPPSASLRVWLGNRTDAATEVSVEVSVTPWSPDVDVGEAPILGEGQATATLDARGEAALELEIIAPDAALWSTDSPALHRACVEVTDVDGEWLDEHCVRFGFRTVEWRAAAEGEPAGFFLNGERYPLRGSNITLHRFFEDEAAAALAWDREWVRGLLSGPPTQLHWDVMRMTIGRAPRLWYEIADEEGMLLADEFAWWTLIDPSSSSWTVEAIAEAYRSWIREAWNHPSIAWWDGANETQDARVNAAIDLVRDEDPSRQWENGGFNQPHRPGDPIEDHPYLFTPYHPTPLTTATLLQNSGLPPQGGFPGFSVLTHDSPGSPYILNEYAWVWVNRDGSPTELTAEVHESFLGPGPHPVEVHRELCAYIVGLLTEFWRARGGFAAIQHFTYLGYSKAGGATSDNFIDVAELVLEPRFVDYAEDAFAPLGVVLEYWSELPGEAFTGVTLVNDLPAAQTGALTIRALDPATGDELARSGPAPVSVGAFEHAAVDVEFTAAAAAYVLVADLEPDDASVPAARSIRKVGLDHLGVALPTIPEP